MSAYDFRYSTTCFAETDNAAGLSLETIKDFVFWANVFLILCAVITGKFRWLFVSVVIAIPREAFRKVGAILRRERPSLDMRPLLEDTMLARQRRQYERIWTERLLLTGWEKRKLAETARKERPWLRTVYGVWWSKLFDFSTNILMTTCHGVDDASIPIARSRCKDLRMFRNLNTPCNDNASKTVGEPSQSTCVQCGYTAKINS